MTLSPSAVEAIREAFRDTPHGARGGLVRELAERYGVSRTTIYRAARLGGTSRRRAARRPEYRDWVEIAVGFAHRAPMPMPLDLAIEGAVEAQDLPPEALGIPPGTAHRIRRELGLRPTGRRTQRIHADYPMQAVQFDASTSAHIYPVRRLEDGDWLLALHRSPIPAGARGYKNRPLGPDRMRVLVYGIWDICTGYTRAVYMVSAGENAADAAVALAAMLARTGDPRRPLHGVPDDLWSDQGPLFRSGASRELLDRLGVALVTGAPYKKERMGGVERAWRTLWARFERGLFARAEDEIRLSALNERLAEHERRQAERPARVRVGGRAVSRAQAWTALVNGRPADNPLRAMPPNAIATLHRQGHRTLDSNGLLQWAGEWWECPDWHSRRVAVRQALAGEVDSLTLEDPRTGERSVARRYRPRRYGEVRGIPATALDRLLDAAVERPGGGADLFAPRGEAGGTVVALRPRTAPAAHLPDPLDADHYPDAGAALAAFAALYPYPLSAADRAAVEAHLREADLRRDAVAELASRLLREVTDGAG